jgi:spermidine synthase
VRTVRHLSLYIALFLSGAAALAYQTTWGRMLDRVFGVGDLAVATVLAAFFLGLGIGSAYGGRYAQRLTRPAWAYAALELGIGVWALLSLGLIPNVHHLYAWLGSGAPFGLVTVIRFVLALLLLLPPTVLMGATLPVLVRVVARAGGGWSREATQLYVINTLGAATGAGVTGLLLLPRLGNRVTLMCAAGASIAGGLLVLSLFRAHGQVAAELDEEEEVEESLVAVVQSPSRVGLACALAFMAGLASLSGEVLWTRVLRIVLHGTTPAFASMLVCYLVGIAGGSLIAERVGRGRDPGRLFGWLQGLMALLTVGAMWLSPHLPRILGLVGGEADLDPYRTWVMLATAAVLLLPLALVLGTSIPLAWRLAGGTAEVAAQNAGRVLAWNTIGGLLGSLLAGFLMVPTLGIELSLVTITMVHLLTTAVAFRGTSVRLVAKLTSFVVPALVAVAIFLWRPTIDLPFLLHARNDAINAIIEGPAAPIWEEQIVSLREGRNTTVTITDEDGLLRLYNDGRPESGFGGEAPGFGAELSMLGSLPVLFAKEHDRAMVIGLGAGHTAAVMLGGDWSRLDVIELEEAVVEAARELYEAEEEPFPLDDARAHLIVDDARARLVLSPEGTYDAIVSQPSHPWLAGSSALYTQEFFEEAARALKPGGVMCLWVNLFRTELSTLEAVTATLRSVFPHGHAFVVEDSSWILIASREPIPLDDGVAERVRSEGLRPYMEPQGLDHIIDLAAVRELDGRGFHAFGADAELIHDDKPLLEFQLAQTASGMSVAYTELDYAVYDTPWISGASYERLPERYRDEVLLARIREVENRVPGLHRLEASVPELEMPEDERELVLGRLFEAKGYVRTALEHYDASSDPDAALSADELRHAERAHYRLVTVAHDREVIPYDARPYLSSALAVDQARFIERALAVAEEADDDDEATLIEVARGYLEGGCEGLLAAPSLAFEVRRDEFVALIAARCAFRAGDEERALRYVEERTRVRRALALEEGKEGREAENNGNISRALRHFRRSLMANPAHGPSAAALARILSDRGQDDEAQEILREAAQAAEGLPQSTSAIEGAAESLMLSL